MQLLSSFRTNTISWPNAVRGSHRGVQAALLAPVPTDSALSASRAAIASATFHNRNSHIVSGTVLVHIVFLNLKSKVVRSDVTVWHDSGVV